MKKVIISFILGSVFWCGLSQAGIIDWAQRSATNEHLAEMEAKNKDTTKLLAEILVEVKSINKRVYEMSAP